MVRPWDRAVRIAEAEAAKKVREHGYNTGADVQKYQAATWLRGTGWSWCCAFVVWCFKTAGKHDVRPTASVQDFFDYYKSKGCQVSRPYRGDVICYDWSSRGRYGSHIGFVSRVLALRKDRFLVRTVEGNTSSGEAGSQDNGDGVYLRKRWALVKAGEAAFLRVTLDS
jgi:hypothetical protein